MVIYTTRNNMEKIMKCNYQNIKSIVPFIIRNEHNIAQRVL